MASHQELSIEWSMLDSNYINWTEDDLQLAAELGRTLLDRNEELENELKTQQAIIDDQRQEIEFQMKQIASMKEESLNRSKFYDQLETSVIELERSNTQLSRKHEVDKKRIQSMCENIDYLERKCEELSGTLESIRDTNKKHYSVVNKLNRSSYFLQINGHGGGGGGAGSSDSSEDDSGYFRTHTRRTQSLQDLRDFSSSPDDLLDSSPSSNSPDLKLSENEFIQSLESRIEELLAAKKRESGKIASLESQLKLLVQENANLHEQLVYVAKDKDEQIKELQIQLMEQTSVPSPLSLPVSTRLNSSQFSSPGLQFAIGSVTTPKFYSPTTPTTTKSQRNSLNYKNQLQLLQLQQQPPTPTATTAVCKRCSEEINILSLVNSIEDDQLLGADGGGEGRFGDDDDFSSLEFELTRASGDQDGYLHENHQSSNFLVLRKSGSGSSMSSARSARHKRLSFDLHETGVYGGLNSLISHPNLSLSLGGHHPHQFNGLLAEANDDFHSLLPTPLDNDSEFNEVGNGNQDNEDDEDEVEISGDNDNDTNEKEDLDKDTTTPEKSLAFYEVDPASLTLRRLKLPEKIPTDELSPSLLVLRKTAVESELEVNNGNGLDEFGRAQVLDTCWTTQGIRKRSKLWWLAWFLLLVAGVLEIAWRFFTFLLCILSTAILPKTISASTTLLLSASAAAPTGASPRYKMLPNPSQLSTPRPSRASVTHPSHSHSRKTL